MRILVAWASDLSPNLGVRALGRGSVDLLKSVWPDATFDFLDFGNKPAQVPLGHPRSLLKARVMARGGMMDWLKQFDLLWDTRSGDSFADIYGTNRHAKMSLLHEFATEAGVTAVLAPQTIGPFQHTTARVLAKRNLRRSRLVFARDPVSAKASARLGRKVDRMATDLVFGIHQPTAPCERDVLVNVSGLLWRANDHVDLTKYRESVRSIIAGLLSDGRDVTLLPHVLDSLDPDNDVPTCRELEREFDGAVGVLVPKGLEDVRDAVAGANVVIGARMHACLNALSTSTPAIAMAYSRKFEPLMKAIDWPHVISVTEAEDPGADVLQIIRNCHDLKSRAQITRSRASELLAGIPQLLGGAL